MVRLSDLNLKVCVNGDGFADLAVGALDDTDTGSVTMSFGGATGLGNAVRVTGSGNEHLGVALVSHYEGGVAAVVWPSAPWARTARSPTPTFGDGAVTMPPGSGNDPVVLPGGASEWLGWIFGR